MQSIYADPSYYQGGHSGYADTSYFDQETALRSTFRCLLRNLQERRITGDRPATRQGSTPNRIEDYT